MALDDTIIAIRNRLLADSVIAAAVVDRAYSNVAPPDAPLPHVLIVVLDAQDIAAMPATRVMTRARLAVYAALDGNAVAAAAALGKRIDALLHLWSSDPHVYAVVRAQTILEYDDADRRTVVLAGGVYDVWGTP